MQWDKKNILEGKEYNGIEKNRIELEYNIKWYDIKEYSI